MSISIFYSFVVSVYFSLFVFFCSCPNNLMQSLYLDSIFIDWHQLDTQEMAHKTDKKFNYFFRKKKIKIIYPILQKNTSTNFTNHSSLIMSKTPSLSSKASLNSYQRFNDISSTIYSTTIIIFFATWIFKKAMYVI